MIVLVLMFFCFVSYNKDQMKYYIVVNKLTLLSLGLHVFDSHPSLVIILSHWNVFP